jgi:hypothetical protein
MTSVRRSWSLRRATGEPQADLPAGLARDGWPRPAVLAPASGHVRLGESGRPYSMAASIDTAFIAAHNES